MIGLGYFWAINRSYDLTYRFQDYNTDAFGHHVDFRGKPRAGTDFDVIVYGVQDRNGDPNNGNQRFSGLNIYFVGTQRTAGRLARQRVHELRQFVPVSARSGRNRSTRRSARKSTLSATWRRTGRITRSTWWRREWKTSSESEIQQPGKTNFTRDAVLLHKLPEAQWSGRDRQLFGNLPIWFSFYSAAGLLYRS